MWDLFTVAQLVHPELFTTVEVKCDIVVSGASQGRIVRTGERVLLAPSGVEGRVVIISYTAVVK